jgi:uncharacterized protein YkwD
MAHPLARLARPAVLATAAVAVAAATVAMGASPASAATSLSTLESRAVKATNAARAAHKCAPLRVDGKLTTAARRHSTDMATKNYFSHVSKDGRAFTTRAAQAGYKAASAENIAWGYPTGDEVVKAWLKSPGHRANILNCKNRAVGVGVARKADGSLMWTQIFGRR